jgi:hypothetical protein
MMSNLQADTTSPAPQGSRVQCYYLCCMGSATRCTRTGAWSSAGSGQRLIAKCHLRLVQDVARAPPLPVACGLHCTTAVSALSPPHRADAMQWRWTAACCACHDMVVPAVLLHTVHCCCAENEVGQHANDTVLHL